LRHRARLHFINPSERLDSEIERVAARSLASYPTTRPRHACAVQSLGS